MFFVVIITIIFNVWDYVGVEDLDCIESFDLESKHAELSLLYLHFAWDFVSASFLPTLSFGLYYQYFEISLEG